MTFTCPPPMTITQHLTAMAENSDLLLAHANHNSVKAIASRLSAFTGEYRTHKEAKGIRVWRFRKPRDRKKTP